VTIRLDIVLLMVIMELIILIASQNEEGEDDIDGLTKMLEGLST